MEHATPTARPDAAPRDRAPDAPTPVESPPAGLPPKARGESLVVATRRPTGKKPAGKPGRKFGVGTAAVLAVLLGSAALAVVAAVAVVNRDRPAAAGAEVTAVEAETVVVAPPLVAVEPRVTDDAPAVAVLPEPPAAGDPQPAADPLEEPVVEDETPPEPVDFEELTNDLGKVADALERLNVKLLERTREREQKANPDAAPAENAPETADAGQP